MLGVEQWAEIRRLALVEGLSQREIRRHTGAGRDTIRRAVRSPEPPSYRSRPKQPSKLDPYRAEIRRLLADEPTLSGVRILEELQLLGYDGSQTILDVLLRELRPRILDAGDCQAKGRARAQPPLRPRQLRGGQELRQPRRLPGPARHLV